MSVQNGSALGGYIATIIIVGLGTGGIKSNIAPLIADQYQRRKMALKTIPKTMERVVIDPAITYQRIVCRRQPQNPFDQVTTLTNIST